VQIILFGVYRFPYREITFKSYLDVPGIKKHAAFPDLQGYQIRRSHMGRKRVLKD
jgi:hypothetical protein